MALQLQTFKKRSITAAVFVAVMLTGLFWNQYSFLILFLIIHFGCWYELVNLLQRIYPGNYLLYCLAGLIYISLPCLMMLDLRSGGNIFKGNFVFTTTGKIISCAIIFSIWINDTMAYLVGSLLGKTPLSAISPKKTWEGTIGGVLICIALISCLGYTIPMARIIPLKNWVVIAALSALFGTMGDLLESKLKRVANIKDSGSFMPGHGGFLDRFDSFLIATVSVWLYINLVL